MNTFNGSLTSIHMKSSHSRLLTIFILISIAVYLLILWLVDFAGFNIPQLIPGLELNTYGILMLLAVIVIFIVFQKLLLRYDSASTVIQLVIPCSFLSVFSVFIFQLIRQCIILKAPFRDKIGIVLFSTFFQLVIFSIIAWIIAQEIKKQRGIWKYVPYALLLLLIWVIRTYAAKIEW